MVGVRITVSDRVSGNTGVRRRRESVSDKGEQWGKR